MTVCFGAFDKTINYNPKAPQSEMSMNFAMSLPYYSGTVEDELVMVQCLKDLLQMALHCYNRPDVDDAQKQRALTSIQLISQRTRSMKLALIVRALDDPAVEDTLAMRALCSR